MSGFVLVVLAVLRKKNCQEGKKKMKKIWSINSRKSKDSRGQFNGTDTSASLVLHG